MRAGRSEVCRVPFDLPSVFCALALVAFVAVGAGVPLFFLFSPFFLFEISHDFEKSLSHLRLTLQDVN